MIPLIANHLWQSTLFAAIAALLALALRKNGARTRHWLWLAASVKFLVPFSLLVGIGNHLGWTSAPAKEPGGLSYLMDEIGQPFTPRPAGSVASLAPAPSATMLPYIVVAVWFFGCVAVLLSWWRRWRRVAAVVRAAVPLTAGREFEALRRVGLGGTGFSRYACSVKTNNSSGNAQAKAYATPVEPGIFGIFRPILLLPAGIADRLDGPQLEALIAHELCHVRRRDNLAATVHMLVEAVFWFHPLVWWIGARLVAERERACDEEVLRMGSAPEVYAEGILEVCRLYLESPLFCVSGITGANLKRRIEGIMMHHTPTKLNFARRTLLATLGAAAVAGPIAIGLVYAPPSRAQSPAESAAKPVFEVASIKPNKSFKDRPVLSIDPGQITYTSVSLSDCLQEAYSIRPYQISGPDWIRTERFDIAAKAAGAAPVSQVRLMLQALLADRFKMTIHREKKELPVYALVVGKSGPKFKSAADESPEPGAHFDRGAFTFKGSTMKSFADFLGRMPSVGRPVVDMTELSGSYDLTLKIGDLDPEASPADMKRSLRDWTSIFTDVQNSLGLKLEPRKSELEMLVIDHAERVPTEN